MQGEGAVETITCPRTPNPALHFIKVTFFFFSKPLLSERFSAGTFGILEMNTSEEAYCRQVSFKS